MISLLSWGMSHLQPCLANCYSPFMNHGACISAPLSHTVFSYDSQWLYFILKLNTIMSLQQLPTSLRIKHFSVYKPLLTWPSCCPHRGSAPTAPPVSSCLAGLPGAGVLALPPTRQGNSHLRAFTLAVSSAEKALSPESPVAHPLTSSSWLKSHTHGGLPRPRSILHMDTCPAWNP